MMCTCDDDQPWLPKRIEASTRRNRKALSSSKHLALNALEAAFDKNAYQPVLLDVAELTSYTDYILVLSGRSIRQVEAISEAIQQGLKQRGRDPLGVEGQRGGQWMLLDYSDLIVHVFYHPAREFYDLDGLWSDANQVALDVPPELRSVQLA